MTPNHAANAMSSVVSPSSPLVSIVPSFSSVPSCPIRTLSLRSPPVNSMNGPFWRAFATALSECEASPSCRCVIIESGLSKDIFTAGNDLNELYVPSTSLERFNNFWRVSNEAIMALYSSRLFTVAAIRGACPAGGCIMALACDYRVLVDSPSSSLGLNEVALGLAVPKYWMEIFANHTGRARAEALLGSGALVNASDALRFGLVDELFAVPSAAAAAKALHERAEAVASQRLKLKDEGRTATKQLLREELLARWRAYLPEETRLVWSILSQPAIVAQLGKVVQRLQNNKTSKL